jgi:hypothetical protein
MQTRSMSYHHFSSLKSKKYDTHLVGLFFLFSEENMKRKLIQQMDWIIASGTISMSYLLELNINGSTRSCMGNI